MDTTTQASINHDGLPAAKTFRKITSNFKIDGLSTSQQDLTLDHISSASTQTSCLNSFKSMGDLLNEAKTSMSALSSNENLLQAADNVTFDFSAINYEDLTPLEELEDDASSISSFDEEDAPSTSAPNRNHRKEQLMQLIAAKAREAENLLAVNSKNSWELRSEKPSWTIHSKFERGLYWIRNSLKVKTTMEKARGLISQMDKRKENSRSILKRKVLEQISKDCSIIYEKSNQAQIGLADCLTIQLQKLSSSGFKMAEMSIEDRRCPAFAGIKREQMELRFWYATPHEAEEAIELILIQSFKHKAKEISEIEAAAFLAQNCGFIKSLGRLVDSQNNQ